MTANHEDTRSTTVSVNQRSIAPSRGNSERIRNNLMRKLGVETDKVQATNQNRGDASLLGIYKVQKEPLKNLEEPEIKQKQATIIWALSGLFGGQQTSQENSDLDDLAASSLSSSISSREGASPQYLSHGSSPMRRKLKFNEQVEVCLIPKKEEYSKRIRSYLWTNPEEMAFNAHRNTVEFAAEGWDWRNAMEDDNMYRCLSTNELIHPVHIEHSQQAEQTE